ncbi:MAG: cyclic beta 1-2 glucan synthetase, partial [Actinobacteria bacterium]
YDTETLQPLRPGYVSTVDSGNLAGHLLVLRIGLLEATEAPLLGPQLLDGIADTALLALDDLTSGSAGLAGAEAAGPLRADIDELRRRVTIEPAPESLGEWLSLLSSLDAIAEGLPARFEDVAAAVPDADASDAGALARVRASVNAVVASVRGPLRDVSAHAPWAHLLTDVPPSLRSCPQYGALCPLIEHTPSLVGLAEGLDAALTALDDVAADPPGDDETACSRAAEWASTVADGIRAARPGCVHALASARLQAEIAREMWEHTDFRMLYDPSRQLFSIGFNSSEGKLDNSFYDMLASECRLASFLAVAKGDVPQDHWFRLSRQLAQAGSGHALVSWSASMFEYLMPLLVMRTWPETLLDETCRAVVRRQIEYGKQREVPWGISESAFNAKDADLTYQYQAFGVPGLGLKRGLSDDVVVAPYASMLALQVDRPAALANLEALRKREAQGWFGFYEAVDYTPARIPAGARRAIVKAYFAHHQGMGFVALAGELSEHRMRERFHADPMVRSAELLLQERVPRHPQLARPHTEEVRFVRSVRELPPALDRSYGSVDTYTPATHFLSNGSYSVMVTNAGGGYSRRGDMAVSRYREDVTRDCWGTFFFVRDLDTGEVWSPAHQPVGSPCEDYRATFSESKAEYWRRDAELDTHCEVVVSPEDDAEVRRVTFSNRSRTPRRLEVTSYFEVALAPQAADQAHKAFSNLFVETEALADLHAVLFSRRPRSAAEARPWGFHVVACESGGACDWSCETDRARFIGRLRQ